MYYGPGASHSRSPPDDLQVDHAGIGRRRVAARTIGPRNCITENQPCGDVGGPISASPSGLLYGNQIWEGSQTMRPLRLRLILVPAEDVRGAADWLGTMVQLRRTGQNYRGYPARTQRGVRSRWRLSANALVRPQKEGGTQHHGPTRRRFPVIKWERKPRVQIINPSVGGGPDWWAQSNCGGCLVVGSWHAKALAWTHEWGCQVTLHVRNWLGKYGVEIAMYIMSYWWYMAICSKALCRWGQPIFGHFGENVYRLLGFWQLN